MNERPILRVSTRTGSRSAKTHDSSSTGPSGVSARTVRRRLSSVWGLFGFLHARGDVEANPVPRGPPVRTPRTLPRVLESGQVDALLAALRTWRDRAMAEAMVLGGLRRCEANRRVFIAEGKGGRLVPVSGRFFASVASPGPSRRDTDVTIVDTLNGWAELAEAQADAVAATAVEESGGSLVLRGSSLGTDVRLVA
jgi:hypothetical protein